MYVGPICKLKEIKPRNEAKFTVYMRADFLGSGCKQPKAAASLIVSRACQYVAAYDTQLPVKLTEVHRKALCSWNYSLLV